jgi:hypothetical protein
MRKKELSEEQLEERNLFVKHLEKAGWTDTGVNQMFDDGDFVSEESQMEYTNDKMGMLFEFSAKIRGLRLNLTADSGKEVNFVVQYEEKLKELLKLITSFQDKISAQNYKGYMSKVLELCPQTFADVPEKGLHKLVEDEGDLPKKSEPEEKKSDKKK